MKRVVAMLALALPLAAQSPEYVRERVPALLDWEELRQLGEMESPPPELTTKMQTLLTTAFVNNEAWLRGVRPLRPDLRDLGPSMRVAVWNVERGLRLDEIKRMYRAKEQFIQEADAKNVHALLQLGDDIEYFKAADVLILNELDWGMKRTEYREVVRELGEALDMNWAYAVEFLEVDPVHLGTEGFDSAELEESRRLQEMIQVDRGRFRGMHGTAVLSRYPIREAFAIPHTVVGYDWYAAEKAKVSKAEQGRRLASEKVFLETILREIRRGGRTLLLVTLDVPDLPEKQVTIAAAHLENHCPPAQRLAQMREVLKAIEGVTTPVILAGDLNTTLSDGQPVTIKREIYKRVGSASFWAERGLKWATGVGLAYDILTGGVNKVKNLNDPTARHVPVVAPNPEHELFEVLERFRFGDGGAFDFRGDRRHSGLRSGTLANSNERAAKGFETTYQVTRTIGPIGQLKLDWIFVKPYGGGRPESFRFSPHYPRVMRDLNFSYGDRLSDHNPMTVDLPFGVR